MTLYDHPMSVERPPLSPLALGSAIIVGVIVGAFTVAAILLACLLITGALH